MRLLCRFLGFQRMVAFVDLLLEDEEHDQAKQCGTGGDQQQVGIVGGSAGCAGDGAACEGVGAEQAADDGDAMDGETFMADRSCRRHGRIRPFQWCPARWRPPGST